MLSLLDAFLEIATEAILLTFFLSAYRFELNASATSFPNYKTNRAQGLDIDRPYRMLPCFVTYLSQKVCGINDCSTDG